MCVDKTYINYKNETIINRFHTITCQLDKIMTLKIRKWSN